MDTEPVGNRHYLSLDQPISSSFDYTTIFIQMFFKLKGLQK